MSLSVLVSEKSALGSCFSWILEGAKVKWLAVPNRKSKNVVLRKTVLKFYVPYQRPF